MDYMNRSAVPRVRGGLRRLALAPAVIMAVIAGLGLATVTGAARSDVRQLNLARISWAPETPVRGTVFRIRVEPTGAGIDRIEATVAGEPLHFHPLSDSASARAGNHGVRVALAAVPVSAGSAATLRIEVRTVDGESESREVTIPLSAGDYAMEELSVAPEYDGGWDAETAARIQGEVARAKAVSRASHNTPRMWDAPFMRPRPGQITSGFGNGRVFNGQVQSRHKGVDFEGDIGDPVRATAKGVVRIVDALYLGGNAVYIDHGAGLVTAYLHLSEAEVQEGDTVRTGEVIGRVGATGRVTGPHLHWIVRYGPISVDGMSLPGIERAGAANSRGPGR